MAPGESKLLSERGVSGAKIVPSAENGAPAQQRKKSVAQKELSPGAKLEKLLGYGRFQFFQVGLFFIMLTFGDCL